jgi:hypothetical protein
MRYRIAMGARAAACAAGGGGRTRAILARTRGDGHDP